MTREEAAKILKEHRERKFKHTFYTLNEYQAATDMAIKALEQEPCKDVVSRAEIIHTLNTMDRYVADELTLCDTDKKYPKNEVFIVDDVYELIAENLPSVKPHTRWIPVSERLPEDGTWNLFTDGKQISVERFKLDAVNHFFPEGRWFSFDEAVAWMPLPELYKGESEV